MTYNIFGIMKIMLMNPHQQAKDIKGILIAFLEIL
jgi:hypothetical protein